MLKAEVFSKGYLLMLEDLIKKSVLLLQIKEASKESKKRARLVLE